MLSPKEKGCETVMLKGLPTHLQKLSKVIGKTLSSYTQGINIQNKTTGNLFQKKTKAKCLTDPLMSRNYGTDDYLTTCFHYIHNNPLNAGLVRNLADWPYSSWPDYYGNRKGIICNKQVTIERLGMSAIDFIKDKPFEEDQKIMEFIW
jgi:putative transposase